MTNQAPKEEKGTQEDIQVDVVPSVTTRKCGCDIWGVRITTTLLTNLSDRESSDLAEHTKSCSECATLLRQYQFIEESIKRLPIEDLGFLTDVTTNPLVEQQENRQTSTHALPRTTKKRRRKKKVEVILLANFFSIVIRPTLEALIALSKLVNSGD